MDKITPRVDIAFKKIFGVEENKDLLMSLINSIVGEEDKVTDVTLLNPYNPKNFKKDKLSILDIKAKGMDGKKFNIEEGKIQGKAEGKAEGIQEGLEKGERANAKKTARKMIQKNVDMDTIIEFTELTCVEIEALIKEGK